MGVVGPDKCADLSAKSADVLKLQELRAFLIECATKSDPNSGTNLRFSTWELARRFGVAEGIVIHEAKEVSQAMLKCRKLGLTSPVLSDFESLSRPGTPPVFLREECFGSSIVQHNRIVVLRSRYNTLDDVTAKTLSANSATLLGLAHPASARDIARALATQGIINPRIPDNYQLPSRQWCFYFEEGVVGEKAARANLGIYLTQNFPTLDQIPRKPILASALGVSFGIDEMVKEILRRGYYDWQVPNGQRLGRGGGYLSHYFNVEVLGSSEKVIANAHRFIQYGISDLDNWISSDHDSTLKTLSSILKLPRSAKKLAAYAVQQGLISPEIPPKHALSYGGHSSSYIDPDVVGVVWAERNLRAHVLETYNHLDQIERHVRRVLASALGLQCESRATLAQACVQKGWLNPTIPDGHKIKAGGATLYFDEQAVGPCVAVSNLRRASSWSRWPKILLAEGRCPDWRDEGSNLRNLDLKLLNIDSYSTVAPKKRAQGE